MTVITPPEFVVTVDGERRDVTETWPDGSWSCPFCGAPNVPGTLTYDEKSWDAPCSNPACLVGGGCTVEHTAAVRLRQAREQEAATQRAWLLAAQEKAAAEREQRRDEAIAAFTEEAREHRWCRRCWAHSTSYGMWTDRAKKVRHRKPENCPEERRDAQRRAR